MFRLLRLTLASTILITAACRPETASPPSAVDEEPSTSTRASASPTSPACVPADHRLCPTDEGTSDPTFAAFRENLLDSVARKDATKLLTMVDPKIRTTFGEGGGIDDFRKQWSPGSAASLLWPELEAILRMGGSFNAEGDQRSFWAPYVFSAWPEQLDAFTYVAAIRAGVPVAAAPDPAARTVATLDWDLVERTTPTTSEESPWIEITTRDGTVGWVQRTDVRSPVAYRAGFSRNGGSWKMDALVAGD